MPYRAFSPPSATSPIDPFSFLEIQGPGVSGALGQEILDRHAKTDWVDWRDTSHADFSSRAWEKHKGADPNSI